MVVDKDINVAGASQKMSETLAYKLKRQSDFRLFCLTYLSHFNVNAACNTEAGSSAMLNATVREVC